jgi:hypothetical protein
MRFHILPSLFVLILVFSIGCQKFDNDETISLHRAINRIEGQWEVYSWVDTSGNERIGDSASMHSYYVLAFEKFQRVDRKESGWDGKISASSWIWGGATLNWRMDPKQENLYVTGERAITVSRLDKDELWIEDYDIVEFRPVKIIKFKRISD